MPQQSLSCGPPFTMLAGIAYALPPVKCTIFSDVAPTLTQSDTPNFASSVAVTLNGGQAELAGGFLKAVADALVVLKRN